MSERNSEPDVYSYVGEFSSFSHSLYSQVQDALKVKSLDLAGLSPQIMQWLANQQTNQQANGHIPMPVYQELVLPLGLDYLPMSVPLAIPPEDMPHWERQARGLRERILNVSPEFAARLALVSLYDQRAGHNA